MYEPIEEIRCTSAEHLLAQLSTRGPHFRDVPPVADWLFRGHGRASYRLVPTALRAETSDDLELFAELPVEVPQEKRDTNVVQAWFEFSVLEKLLFDLDRYGLPIPLDSHTLRQKTKSKLIAFKSIYNGTNEKLPWWGVKDESMFVPLIALAQHSGLPTRLLDWTTSGFVAAYFAARDNIKHGEGQDGVVWAFDSDSQRYDAKLALSSDVGIRPINAPRASNPNLHAQDGTFTLFLPKSTKPFDAVDRTPLEDVIRGIGPQFFEMGSPPLMYRFVFASSIAGQVLWLLAKEGITYARLFPGHLGVVEAMRERRNWNPTTEKSEARASASQSPK